MNATLSTRQIRLVGLLVLVVVLAGGYLVTRHKSSTPSTASSTPAVTTPPVTTPAQTTPAPSKGHSHPVAPAKLQTHGLPVQVARALQKHSVVVVSLTTPRGADDQVVRAEAQAGAVAAGAGYVSIDVFHQHPGTAILHKLGVVDMPAILVVKRPGSILSDFTGFVDRDVVVQAVTDAR
jgi:thiol:disulfide interchange protein